MIVGMTIILAMTVNVAADETVTLALSVAVIVDVTVEATVRVFMSAGD